MRFKAPLRSSSLFVFVLISVLTEKQFEVFLCFLYTKRVVCSIIIGCAGFPYLSHHNGGVRYQPPLGEVGLDLVRVSSLASADDLPGGRHVR